MGGVKSSITRWAQRESKNLFRVEEVVAGVVLNRASIIAPKLTGALRGNGRTEVRNGHHAVVFGDEDVPYARRRHFENKKNPQTLQYLKRGGDSVKKENIKKYVDMSR